MTEFPFGVDCLFKSIHSFFIVIVINNNEITKGTPLFLETFKKLYRRTISAESVMINTHE